MTATTGLRPRVLCVDDEPLVLGGLARTLRPHCDVRTAVGGRAGIEALAADPDIAVVISDLRMPDLDGATFLACVRRVAPDAVRILLTGQANVDGAIAAVNDGQVFRFLLKPIAPPLLRATIDEAVAQHRALEAQRATLESTVPHGVALFVHNLLAAVHPAAFARAVRLQQLVGRIGPRLALAHRWPVETAAMLSQVGVLALPRALGERVCGGSALTPEEQHAAREVPLLAERFLTDVARLESVRYILRHAVRPAQPSDAERNAAGVLGARLLRFALAYDELSSQGIARAAVLAALAHDADDDDALVLAALQEHVEHVERAEHVVRDDTHDDAARR